MPTSRRSAAEARTPAPATPSGLAPDAKIPIPEGARPLRRFFLVACAAVGLTFIALATVGYAGVHQRGLANAFAIAGFSSMALPPLLLVTLVALAAAAVKRARSGRPSLVPWALTLFTILSGSFGTYSGWVLVNRATFSASVNDRLVIWNQGMFEANSARFLALFTALPLMLALVAIPGISGMASASHSRVGPLGMSPRGLVVGTGLSAVLAVLGLGLGAPSAAIVAMTVGFSFLIALSLPTVHVDTAPRDELERAGASVLALCIAAAIAFARIESRRANAWSEELSRAERVAELTSAAAERSTTTAVAFAAALLLLVIEMRRIGRLWRLGYPPRPRGTTWVLLGLILATVIADVAFHVDYLSHRARMRADTEAHFALFAQLEPPVAASLDAARFAPHFAPALQVTRDMIALNGDGLSTLAAVEGTEGQDILRRDILHAVGAAARARREGPMPEGGESVDLALTIDRQVPYGSVHTLLAVARQSGVRRAELRLLREEPPSPGEGAPPEAYFVLPRDFVAIVVDLHEEGFAARPDTSYGDAIAPLLEQAARGEVAAVDARTNGASPKGSSDERSTE